MFDKGIALPLVVSAVRCLPRPDTAKWSDAKAGAPRGTRDDLSHDAGG